jgi:peptidoglycan hydrolase CwlO-like protein
MTEIITTHTSTYGIFKITNIYTQTEDKEADLEKLAEEVSTLLTKIAKSKKNINPMG